MHDSSISWLGLENNRSSHCFSNNHPTLHKSVQFFGCGSPNVTSSTCSVFVPFIIKDKHYWSILRTQRGQTMINSVNCGLRPICSNWNRHSLSQWLTNTNFSQRTIRETPNYYEGQNRRSIVGNTPSSWSHHYIKIIVAYSHHSIRACLSFLLPPSTNACHLFWQYTTMMWVVIQNLDLWQILSLRSLQCNL